MERRQLLKAIPVVAAMPLISTQLEGLPDSRVAELKPGHYLLKLKDKLRIDDLNALQQQVSMIFDGTGIHIIIVGFDFDLFALQKQ